MILPLQKGILYGPIDSRRLGKSLGINLMPCRYKLCSFNCIYCHYGLTDILTLDIKDHLKDLPKTNSVLDEIEHAMRSNVEFNYITFSGNGEPTLHPNFYDIVNGVVGLKNKYRPNLKIALLSNSSGVKIEGVRRSISKIDLPVFKLDVGEENKFQKINRPAKNVNFEAIVESLKQLDGIYIQTVLMDGNPSNIGEDDLESYFEKIARIKPVEAQIYSLDRPVLNQSIKRVSPEELEKIADIASKKTGVRVNAYYM